MLIFVLAIAILIYQEVRNSRNGGQQKKQTQNRGVKEPIESLRDWMFVLVSVIVAMICVIMVFC